MNPSDLERLLTDLLYNTAEALLGQVQSGGLEPKDYAVVIKFLKDNDMTLASAWASAPKADPELCSDVPFHLVDDVVEVMNG